MEFLSEYGLFLAKAATLVIAILIVVVGVLALGQRQKHSREGHIEVHHLNDRYQHMGEVIRNAIVDKATLKLETQAEKKTEKERAKAKKRAARALAKGRKEAGGQAARKPRLFTLAFDGDMKASATDHLREEISALLPQLKSGDAVLLKLESPGGMVHSYGLAASQLRRITDAGVDLTVAVDKVAASGGYMMACVAKRIIAAPFAVIGSIGVVAQMPNFHRLLEQHNIDFELLTAGEYKRTLSLFGENTEKGREKFVEELENTHHLFKAFVAENRPSLDVDKVATGETWYGRDALKQGLVDDLKTSDAYIQEHLTDWDVYEVRYVEKKHWQEKLGLAAEGAIERAFLRLWQRNRGPHV